MSELRFTALKKLLERKTLNIEFSNESPTSYFGQNVFNREKMQKYLSKDIYNRLMNTILTGANLDRKVADQIAAGMKSWAIENGATHYTHWFHPLTDSTAEKHDAFLEVSLDGSIFENFDGSVLVQQEPDASSLPSGGLRNTFEARGYTAWDPSSPAFITNKTLCIPTIFISYNGEALDYKTPLLRSLEALDKHATKICQYFNKDVKKVFTTVGYELEYFLIDDALYNARPDLILTGRTLIGHGSAKDQQMQDHYFGAIPQRVEVFMQDFEIEAYKLGIPVKTRHNEVAPNQFECSLIFEEANLAADHSLMLMEIIRKTARKHNFRALFHEKPFKDINGSAKHTNWSMLTDTGVNLLKPGKNPMTNIQFLAFLVNTIKAVYDNADLLRASIVSPSNELRLGGNEAPPTIISVFLGEKLSKILDELEDRLPTDILSPEEKTEIKLDIGKIPEILLDNTDRNRTSPFAFTGNRFEFRAVGSSANPSSSLIVINTAIAEQLHKFYKDVEKLRKEGIKKDEAILQTIRKIIKESKKIRFEGNGYSQDWIKEAEKRGLKNILDPLTAIHIYNSEKSISLFEKHNVLSKNELNARVEVLTEKYKKNLQIESRVLGDIVINHIVPAVVKYQNILLENVKSFKSILDEKEFNEIASDRIQLIKDISKSVSLIKKLVEKMRMDRKEANNKNTCEERLRMYIDNVLPYFEKVRYYVDRLERVVDNELWPLPKYRELLYNH